MAAKGMADRKMEDSFLLKVREEAAEITRDLIVQAKPEKGDILIVGCSSSEVSGP